MSYTVEDVNGCTKKLSFNIENIDLTKEIEVSLKEKQKTSNLKGFRKGKAPLSMIQQMYGPQIENDALYRFISSQFMDAVQKEGIRALGLPNFANTKYESGKSVSFEAVVETLPDFKLKDISGLSFKKESTEVAEEDILKVRDQYLERKAEMVEKKDVALENGLFAVINFEGEKEDGERPANMKGEEHLLEIGSNTFIPGFEEGLIGLKAGDKKTIELSFPSDYHEETLKDAKVKFHTEVLEIKERKLPDFNDELAKEFGYESVDDFMTKTREQQEYQKERESKQKLHQDILDKLIEENTFDIPAVLVSQQEKAVREDLAQNLKSQGYPEEMVSEYYEKWEDDIKQRANFQVRSGLILDKLATEFGVESSEADMEAKFAEMAKMSNITVDQVKSYYNGNEKVLSNLKYAIREEKTFEQICEKVTIN